ncbi:hypothetical protein IWQ62_000504 [Dispira parvispora]|uniref:Ribosomal RNA-processing protein 7 n=1 Tax=Dispira parvispora TaxID=1520584 RepID=A0A9W8AUA8_9FUNG|nr:hypothetical protein IWQ62_000504 [Dispira parvispora]
MEQTIPHTVGPFSVWPVVMPMSRGQTKPVVHYLYYRQHHDRAKSKSESVFRITSAVDLPEDRTLFLVNLPVDVTETVIRRFLLTCGKVTNVYFHTALDHNPLQKVHPALLQPDATNPLLKQVLVKRNDDDSPKYWLVDTRSTLSHPLRSPFYLSGTYAHVVFSTAQELQNALALGTQAVTQPGRSHWPKDDIKSSQTHSNTLEDIEHSALPLRGLDRYLAAYAHARPLPDVLQKDADEFMDKFYDIEKQRRQALAELRSAPDEDGFVTVTRRKGRSTVSVAGNISAPVVGFSDAQTLKPKNHQVLDFYSFQTRQAKRNQLIELRQKFEKDKERIAELKVARRFRPY